MIESFFIGPHGENAEFLGEMWAQLLQETLEHRLQTFPGDSPLPLGAPSPEQHQAIRREIDALFEILYKEVPTFSNRYLGHMVSDISIPALIGNIAVLFCNPNLASKEVATAGIYFETQAINRLAEMIGFRPGPCRGHFTSGGTLANFEAFWRARYRMDHWLSMSAYLLEKGLTSEGIFRLAHLGWKAFYDNKAEHDIELRELRERSYVIRGPWDIANYYRDTLKRDFPQPIILVPGTKHYSWPKSANVFGVSENAIWPTSLDRHGRVCVRSLAANIEKARRLERPIMMNVSVAGTTELGTVDPVDEVNELLRQYRRDEGIHIWHHVDAAYGGYFCATYRDGQSELDERTVSALSALAQADSVTLDPHKLGFVPYACGAFLVRDARSYSVSHISAPYLEEEKGVEYPTWSTTLEGSRSGTGAGAVWFSAKVLPLDASGHGKILNQSLRAKRHFEERLREEIRDIRLVPGSDTNIICFAVAPEGSGLRETNQVTEQILHHFQKSPNFAVSRTALALKSYHQLIDSVVEEWGGTADDDYLLVIRMVVMSPYLSHSESNDRLLSEFIAELRECLAGVYG